MKKVVISCFILCLPFLAFTQQNVLTLGMQFKPIFSSEFFGAGAESATFENFTATRTPKLGISFGMQIRRGITKMFSYETGINYIRRNYLIEGIDENIGLVKEFDFGLVGYEIPHQLLVYIRLGENFYMNTATGISFNWFASDVASQESTLKFTQRTFLTNGWIKFALIANIGFEFRTEKSGYFYLGSSLTNPFNNFANTVVKYDENTVADKEVILPLKGGIFTIDFRYFFKSDPIKNRSKKKKEE